MSQGGIANAAIPAHRLMITNALLLAVPLLAGATGLSLNSSFQAEPASPSKLLIESIRLDEFAELQAEFTEAYDGWRVELRAAEGIKAKRALRKKHPVRSFWDRYQAMADGGEGRALVWMSTSLRNKGLRLSEVGPEKVVIAKQLLKDHSKADWFADGVSCLIKDRKHLDSAWLKNALRTVAKVNKVHAVQAQCKYELVRLLRKEDGKDAGEEADALVAELLDNYADTEHGFKMLAEQTRPEDLESGKTAPDFVGRTIDGHEFKLSDYRGKVVLIDFYGFW